MPVVLETEFGPVGRGAASTLRSRVSGSTAQRGERRAQGSPLQHARTAVCSPHFDDAVLDCWSVLERDPASEVVNVFTAAPSGGFTSWWDQINGASSSAAHVHERGIEDRNALSLAGKTPVNLALLETQYRLRPSPLLHALFRRAAALRFVMLRLPLLDRLLYSMPPPGAEQLAERIAQAVPNASTLCLPAAIGGHPDHLIVRSAGVVLASRGFTVRLYADLPYAIRYGWPRWFSAPHAVRTADRVTAFWGRHLRALRRHIPDPLRNAVVVRLTADERARKAEAVRRYGSQFAALNSGRTRGRLDDDGVFAYEVYWELQATDAGSRQRA
jgi:hypothetical protein